MLLNRSLPVLLLLAGLLACSNSGGNDTGGDAGDGYRLDGDGQAGDDGGGGESGADIPICNEVDLSASPLVNLLLVVDKSASMSDPTSATVPDRTKAEDLQQAVHVLLDRYQHRIRFGWMAFPNQEDCDPGVVLVDIADDAAPLIASLVDAFLPWGGTPTGESLQNARSYFQQLADNERQNFVMLVTDGMPTCPNGGGHNTNDADSQLALQAVGELAGDAVGTFVIGLGEDLNASNPQLLNDMAVAGGHPRAGTVKYHPASSLDELEAAFDEIARTVFDCSFTLEVVPEQPDWVWVYFDGQPVKHDPGHGDGFDYDEVNNVLEFYGSACDELATGQVGSIEVKMGCAPPT